MSPRRPRRRTAAAVAVATATAASLTTVALVPGASAAQEPPVIDCPQVKQAPILADDWTPNFRPIRHQPDRRGVYVPVIMVPDWTGRATHDESRTGDFSAKIDLGVSGPLPPAVVPPRILKKYAPPTPTPAPVPTTAAERRAARQAAKAAAATPAPRPVVPDGRSSLIGQIQNIPGAVVYTFDYRDNSGRWIDDPGIGPALGDAIDCVSSAMGQKVILVTKGVGGLAARYATAGLTEDRTRENKVSTVISYGSPWAGSVMAELLNTGIGKTASEPRMLLRFLLASCGAVKTKGLPYDAPCSYLPTLARQMAGLDGLALRTGSSQLNALRAWPERVAVHAFAGEALVTAPQLGWFGLRPFRNTGVQLGDLVAQAASTTQAARSQLRAPCNIQLDAFGAPNQSAGLRFAEIGGVQAPPAPAGAATAPPDATAAQAPGSVVPQVAAPAAPAPWYAQARPCFNGSLTRIQEFARGLTDIVTREIRLRQPIDLRELEALEVPSVCGFPGGNLVGGTLPGIPDDQGQVALASTLYPERFNQFSVFGDITNDGVPDTLVVLKCRTAEGPGSDTVAAYDNEGRLLGHVVLQNITKTVRNDVYEVTVKRGTVRMRWATARDTDDPEFPTVDATTTFTYDPLQGLIVPGPKVTSYNETLPAQSLLTAIKRGYRQRALNWASPDVVDRMIDADTNYGGLGAASCHGANYRDSSWPPAAVDEYGEWPRPDGVEHGDRFCIVELNGEPVALLGMKHLGFRQWRAVEFRIPTDSPFIEPDDSGFPPVFGPGEEPEEEPTDDPGGGPFFP